MVLHPFFTDTFGCAEQLQTTFNRARATDALFDQLLIAALNRSLRDSVTKGPRRSVVALVPCMPQSRAAALTIATELAASRHSLDVIIDDRPGLWRQAKINLAAGKVYSNPEIDWLVVVDDDVRLPTQFLDLFIGSADLAGLDICQPAHRFHSHASYAVTQRWPGSAIRRTNYVEIGPVLGVRRPLVEVLFPLPETEGGWGIDMIWADLAKRHGWPIGIVDCAPFEHLRVANRDPSRALDGSHLLYQYQPTITRQEMFTGDHVVLSL